MKSILPVLMLCVLVSPSVHAQLEKPKVYKTINYRQPSSQEEAIAKADLIVRVRVDASERAALPPSNGSDRLGLPRRVTVLDVLKSREQIRLGQSIEVRQRSGEFDDGDSTVEYRGDIPLKPQAVYVLFLAKNGSAYRELYGPFSRLELDDNEGVKALGRMGEEYGGLSIGEALAKLKATVR